MKEIRLHGRGGQGVVKAAEVIVHAAVMGEQYAACFPYFGFEKKGGPVSAFVRIDDSKIREKNQVYKPHCIMVVDPTIVQAVDVFRGAQENCVLVINTRDVDALEIPESIGTVAYVDANGLSEEMFGRVMPNTIMLGAFAKATGWVDKALLAKRAGEIWGEKNVAAVMQGYEKTALMKKEGSEPA